MISQEMKDRIIMDISENDEVGLDIVVIEDPVILLDPTGDPWVADACTVELFYVNYYGEWKHTDNLTGEQQKIFDDHVTVVFGVGVVDKAFKITHKDDPEFIEQVKQAIQLSNL